MIKFYIAFFLVLMSFKSSIAQTPFYQYFDGADTVFSQSVNVEIDTSNPQNIWQIGPPQKIIFDSSATLPNALVTDTVNYYPINNVSKFTIRLENQMTFGVLALQWKQKLDMDPGKDGGIIEFTTDHGLSWQNVFNNPYVYNFYGFDTWNHDTLQGGIDAFSGTDTTWKDIWLCFDMTWLSQFPDTLMFRYTFKSDDVDSLREGWMIDNFIAHMTWVHTVKKTASTEYLKVYPNPSNDLIHIETEKRMDYHIIEEMELLNAQGSLVERWKMIPTKFWIDSRKYAEGNYFLRIKTNVRSEIVPIVICK